MDTLCAQTGDTTITTRGTNRTSRAALRGALAGCMAIMGAGAAPAIGQTETATLNPAADATIFFDADTPDARLASGAADSVFAGRTQTRANVTQRALLRFDLSSIPCGARVRSAELALTYFAGGTGVASPVIGVHRTLAFWGEGFSGSNGGAGSNSQPGDADWYSRVNPNLAWNTPGGDFVATASTSRSIPRSSGRYTWPSSAAMVGDVQGWIGNPSSNFGWLLRGNEATAGSTRKFYSREALFAADRPSLRVEYERPSAPNIIVQPVAARACLTRTAAFFVTATGDDLAFRWQIQIPAGTGAWTDLSDGPIPNGGGASASGSGTPTLNLSGVSPLIGAATLARWRCRVSNGCGVQIASDGAGVNLCLADCDSGGGNGACDGGVGIEDLLYYLGLYAAGGPEADIDNGTATGTLDGGVGIDDLLYYLIRYEAGC